MDLENYVIIMGKKIYEKVLAFVRANKGDDDKLYRNAILRLNDGRKMIFPFGGNPGGADLQIWNYHWDDELQRGVGDTFEILLKSGYGFLVNIALYNCDKDPFAFHASDKGVPNKIDLTEEQKEAIMTYITQLYEKTLILEYDKEETHSVGNFTYDARDQYNIKQFKEAMQKLHDTNPDSNVLPSVETAVNWWIKKFTDSKIGGSLGNDFNSVFNMAMANQVFSQTSVNQDQIDAFRESLSRALMDELSKGNEPMLRVDYGPSGILADAMVESGISGGKAPFKTSMTVGVNSVRVSAGYRAEVEEIFANEVQEEKQEEVSKGF